MSELEKHFGPRRAIPDVEHEPPKVSPQVIKRRGEKWTKDYMKKLCGIYVKKRSDAPVVLPDGTQYTPKGLDMYGSVLGPDSPFAWKVEVEVKTFTEGFSLSALKKHQVELLYKASQLGELAMLALVEHEQGKIERMWWMPWQEEAGEEYLAQHLFYQKVPTFSWVAAQLRKKAEEDARFQGKSIRKVDLLMLEKFLVFKHGRKWQLSDTHWLRAVLDIPVEQKRLL